jgi:hypothetical protein
MGKHCLASPLGATVGVPAWPPTVPLPLRCTRLSHPVLLVIELTPVGVCCPDRLASSPLLSPACHLCLAAILLARSALPAQTFLRFVLLSGCVVYWKACDYDALSPRDLFRKKSSAGAGTFASTTAASAPG